MQVKAGVAFFPQIAHRPATLIGTSRNIYFYCVNIVYCFAPVFIAIVNGAFMRICVECGRVQEDFWTFADFYICYECMVEMEE